MRNPTSKAFRTQSHIFKRYLWLLSILYDYKRLSLEEISRKWERSSLNEDGSPFPGRTFRDHLNAIEDIFGISIKNENRGEYRYFIEDPEELKSNFLQEWMLENFSMGNTLSDSRDIQDRILLQDIPSSKTWLSAIIQAIREKTILQVEYTSHNKGKVPTLLLCPYFVKLYDNRWYVYARTKDNPLMKHYSLDCIDDLKATAERFDFEPSAAERSALDTCFGHTIYADIPPQVIFIQATAAAARRLDTLPLHHSQQKVEENDSYTIYRYFFAPTSEFHSVLAQWGGQLKIIFK